MKGTLLTESAARVASLYLTASGMWEARAREMTEEALRWSIQDATEALKASVSRGDTQGEGKYLDQISVFRAELQRRDRKVRDRDLPGAPAYNAYWVYNDAREALANAEAMGDVAGAEKYRRQMAEARRRM